MSIKYVRMRLAQIVHMIQANADDTVPMTGRERFVVLCRRFRDGRETREVLPDWLAEWTLAAIPECEPDVERAKLIR